MSLLSDSESSGDEKKVVERLKINEKFADRFERSERVKDLHRAKELLKNADADEDEESDSESETEDEDAEQLSLGLDLKIIQTINSLRKKDPKIYDPNAKWFDEPEESSSDEEGGAKAKGDSKKKKYKDILREQLLESEAAGGLGDGDGIETSARGVRDTASRNTLVYDAEQEKIRQAFLKSAGKAADDSSDSDDQDGVLRVKRKSAQETKAEELELQRALQEMKELAAKNAKAEESKKGKEKNKNKTVLLESDVEEGFLENYLEKQLWKDKESTQRRRRDAAEESEEENLEEDEAELDQVDRFESKYNFRFEEMQDEKNRLGEGGSGGMVEVMGHARDVQGSMRRADEKRKTQRESRKERKEKERRQQEAELRRLKNLKRQEVSALFASCLMVLFWP
jgi:protein KRI1